MNIWSDEEVAKAAKEELGEEPLKVQEDLEALKAWLAKSPHLKTVRQGDISVSSNIASTLPR